MIIINNKPNIICAVSINAGDGQGTAAAFMPTGRLVLQQSADGTGGGKTPVVDTDDPADKLKSWT